MRFQVSRFNSILFAGAAIVAMPVAQAETVSLTDALRQALEHTPRIGIAEAGLDQARADVGAAKAQRGVNVGVQGRLGVLETSDTSFTQGPASQIPRNVGLQAEIPLYTSGALSAGHRAASRMAEASELGLISSREQAVLETVEAYSYYWLAEQTVVVAQARFETLKLRENETRSRLDQGLVTRTDLALTQARLAGSEAELAGARASLTAARARFIRFTGLKNASPEPPGSIAIDGSLTLTTALDDAIADNPDLDAARKHVEAATERVKQTKGEFGPKLSLSARATAGRELYFFLDDEITDYGAFLTFEMPLFTSGLKSSMTERSIAGRREAEERLRDAELQMQEAVAAVWGDLEARKLALSAAERGDAAAKLAAEGAQREYEAGIRTLVDSLDAEDERRDAEIRLRQAETALLLAQARLLVLLGDLEETLLPP